MADETTGIHTIVKSMAEMLSTQAEYIKTLANFCTVHKSIDSDKLQYDVIKHIQKSYVTRHISDTELEEIDTVLEVSTVTQYLQESYEGDYTKVTISIGGTDIECTMLVGTDGTKQYPLAIIVNEAINDKLKDA